MIVCGWRAELADAVRLAERRERLREIDANQANAFHAEDNLARLHAMEAQGPATVGAKGKKSAVDRVFMTESDVERERKAAGRRGVVKGAAQVTLLHRDVADGADPGREPAAGAGAAGEDDAAAPGQAGEQGGGEEGGDAAESGAGPVVGTGPQQGAVVGPGLGRNRRRRGSGGGAFNMLDMVAAPSLVTEPLREAVLRACVWLARVSIGCRRAANLEALCGVGIVKKLLGGPLGMPVVRALQRSWQEDERQALPRLVRSSRRLWGKDSPEFVEHPMLRRIQPLQVLLRSANHGLDLKYGRRAGVSVQGWPYRW